MEKQKNRPQLRFPGFEGEWERKKLGEVTFKVDKKNSNSIRYPIYSINNKEGFLPQSDQFEGVDSNDRGYDISLYKIIENNTFAYNPARINVGSIGYSGELKNIIISSLYVCFKTRDNINDYFLLIFFKTFGFNKSVLRNVEGGVREYLFYENFSRIKINFPSLPEQTKIASFFTQIDRKIGQLKQKKTLLEQYKKGVMQQLFSQTLRFKDDNGIEFPEWEKKRLGEVGKFISGSGFPENEQGGIMGIPFLKVSDMNLPENNIQIKKSNNYVSDDQIKRLKYKVIKNDSLIFAKVGAAIYLERKRIAKIFLIDNNMMAFIPNGDINFYFHLFNTIRLSKYAQVGALPSYNSSDLSIIKIQIPSLAEQTKIANFLSAIDDKIAINDKRLDLIQNFKKGLLQKMFV